MHIILDFDPDLGFSRDQELAMAIVWKSESFEYNYIV